MSFQGALLGVSLKKEAKHRHKKTVRNRTMVEEIEEE
jgi:hypothetical protein